MQNKKIINDFFFVNTFIPVFVFIYVINLDVIADQKIVNFKLRIPQYLLKDRGCQEHCVYHKKQC